MHIFRYLYLTLILLLFSVSASSSMQVSPNYLPSNATCLRWFGLPFVILLAPSLFLEVFLGYSHNRSSHQVFVRLFALCVVYSYNLSNLFFGYSFHFFQSFQQLFDGSRNVMPTNVNPGIYSAVMYHKVSTLKDGVEQDVFFARIQFCTIIFNLRSIYLFPFHNSLFVIPFSATTTVNIFSQICIFQYFLTNSFQQDLLLIPILYLVSLLNLLRNVSLKELSPYFTLVAIQIKIFSIFKNIFI